MKKYITERNLLAIILIFVVLFIGVIFTSINYNEQEKIKAIENSIIEKSKSHYNHIKEIQLSHTGLFGFYLRNSTNKPNPNLSDNYYTIEDENFTRISHDKMTRRYSRYAKKFDSFYYKLTSLKPLIKRNTPDEFEKKGLEFLQENPSKTYFHDDPSIAIEKGTMDFIGKLTIEKQCIQCHYTQGYKVGDIKGGVRITIDTSELKDTISTIKNKFLGFKVFSIIIGILGLLFSYWIIRYIFQQRKELQNMNDNLEHLVHKRTKELHDLNQNLELRIEEAVEKNKEQEELMIAQSRHAAMGEMISMIAHQWRQPIAAISMGANNIILDIELDDINKENFNAMAHDILDQTKYLTNTIDDFSNFFKPAKEQNLIYPNEVIQESISIIGKSLENNGIILETRFEQTDQLKTFSRELLQVLINIIKNAKEAFDHSDTKRKRITIELKQVESTISISISDNAGGIPEDILEKIFDPYFSTKKEKNGTGLGLYMSKTIINKHLYGNLHVENTDEGARFTIELPKDNK